MTTILLIALTWYLTKLYYTREFNVHIINEDPSMGNIQCSGCSQTIYTRKDNFRNPYYCLTCV
jgi:formamidopyrimidine-DNA glycosylase